MSLHDSKMSYTFKETATDYCCNRRHLCQQFVINCTLIHAILRRNNKIKKTQTYIYTFVTSIISAVYFSFFISFTGFLLHLNRHVLHTCLVYFQAAIVHINIIFFSEKSRALPI